jgi:hypothetical protein
MAGNNKTYLLQVKCPIYFFVDFNTRWIYSICFHRSPQYQVSGKSVQWKQQWYTRENVQSDVDVEADRRFLRYVNAPTKKSKSNYFLLTKNSGWPNLTADVLSGFGGLEVACWPLVPKFAGSHPAEAVRYLGRKNPQHTFLRSGSKAVGPMS